MRAITSTWFEDGKRPISWDNVPNVAALYKRVMEEVEGLGHVD